MSESYYEWTSDSDVDRDTLGVVISALLDDREAAQTILESLDREQLASLTWCLASWYARALKLNVDDVDPVEIFREFALQLAERREEGE